MQKELENNFDILAQEFTKTYLQNTHNNYAEIEENFINLQKTLSQKVVTKCGEIMTQLSYLSESINYYDPEKNTTTITLKPKQGQEKEFNNMSKNFIECSAPFLSVMDYSVANKNYFEKLNNSSFSLCLNDCKSNLLNNKFMTKKGDVNYDELKYCLKDCYNLTTFNFKSYYSHFKNSLLTVMEDVKKL